MSERHAVTVVELRVLDGPNLYFTRPAIKLTLAVPPWLAMPDERVQPLTERAGFAPVASPGVPDSDQRRRFIARFAVHLTRALADATATHLAIRSRPGPDADQVVIAFVWRRQQAAEAFARELAPLLEVIVWTGLSPGRHRASCVPRFRSSPSREPTARPPPCG